jgi:hypothetical protein
MTWNLDSPHASLDLEHWSGAVDLSGPAHGIELRYGKTQLAASGRFFRVGVRRSFTSPLGEAYVRRGDLIARYPQGPRAEFALQLDFRVIEDASDWLCIEAWISIQTDLLDTHPRLDVGFDIRAMDRIDALPGDQPIAIEDFAESASKGLPVGALGICEGPTGPVHAIVLVHPLDQSDCRWEGSKDGHLTLDLFGHFLEKGVIRRARARLCLSTNPIPPKAIDQAYDRFCATPLPLTV